MGRVELLTGIKTLIERNISSIKKIYTGKQTDWQTQSEYPVVWIVYPKQEFDYDNIAVNVLKGQGLVTIRICVENSDEGPDAELDTIIDAILALLLENSTIGGVAKTTDVVGVTTDGGVIITHSIADITLRVQI